MGRADDSRLGVEHSKDEHCGLHPKHPLMAFPNSQHIRHPEAANRLKLTQML